MNVRMDVSNVVYVERRSAWIRIDFGRLDPDPDWDPGKQKWPADTYSKSVEIHV